MNDADGIYYSKVVHSEEGFAIIAPDSVSMYGDFNAYIETDKRYIENQRLDTGLYVLYGKKTMPLVNGSSRTMFSYYALDDESNKLAINAIMYNAEAVEATEKENARRIEERKKNVHDEFMKMAGEVAAKAYSKVDFNFDARVHMPKSMLDKKAKCKLHNDEIGFVLSRMTIKVAEFKKLIEDSKWSEVFSFARMQDRKNEFADPTKKEVEWLVNDSVEGVACATALLSVHMRMPGTVVDEMDPEGNRYSFIKDKYAFICLSHTFDKGKLYKAEEVNGGFLRMNYGDELFVADRNDEVLLKLFEDRKTEEFLEAYKFHSENF